MAFILFIFDVGNKYFLSIHVKEYPIESSVCCTLIKKMSVSASVSSSFSFWNHCGPWLQNKLASVQSYFFHTFYLYGYHNSFLLLSIHLCFGLSIDLLPRGVQFSTTLVINILRRVSAIKIGFPNDFCNPLSYL